MRYSDNYNLNKPERLDQYNVDHWNDNTDIIDEELKKREDDDDALKNPTYTPASSDSQLVSGESIFTAFGKLSKIVSSFITHKATETSVHGSTSLATATKLMERDVNGKVKIADGTEIDDASTLKQIQNASVSKKFIGAKVVSDSNITLFGTQTIDDVSCGVGDVVLVLGQNTATENGLYIVQTGDWTRHPDYNTADKINNTTICICDGTYAGHVYKSSTKTYTAGSTTLIFINSDYPISDEAKVFWRDKIEAGKEYRPAIGIPTLWMGGKPSWAIDFGNGATTKYLWANYPRLWKSDEFKNILTTLSSKGWMTAYDSTGFYVPDLRGVVPIGWGGPNSKRSSEILNGGSNVGAYSGSQNKYHNHGVTKGGTDNSGFTGKEKKGTIADTFRPETMYADGVFTTRSRSGRHTDTSSGNNTIFDFSMTPTGTVSLTVNYNGSEGQASKPATIACMWIVRFE